MKKTALILVIITILSKFVGFAREMVLAHYYGASSISDAYLIAMTIPTTIFALIGSGISTAFIPIYAKIEKSSGTHKADIYTNNLINIVLILCTILVIFGLTFTEQIIKVFASGFKSEILDLAIRFTRVSILGIFFSALINIFIAYLQIKGNYSIPALVGFPMSFCIIVSIVISHGNEMILAIGILLSIMAQFALLIPYILKKGYKYKPTLSFNDPNIKNMVYLSLPLILGVAVNDINVIVDRTLASQISSGGISALNYALTLNNFVQGTVVMSLATVMYPMIAKMVASNNISSLKKVICEAITGINILVIPATIGAMFLTQPIIEMIYGRGAFDEQAVSMTTNALFFYSIGMVGRGLRQILSRPFYAMQDTKTPMINASVGVIINIILNIILSRFLGIGGLALATSVSATIISIFLFISLRKKIGPFGMKQISISFLKILFSSLIMGLLAKLSFDFLTTTLSQNLSLLLAIGIGTVSYLVIIYFMKIEDVDVIVGAIKKKLSRDVAKSLKF